MVGLGGRIGRVAAVRPAPPEDGPKGFVLEELGEGGAEPRWGFLLHLQLGKLQTVIFCEQEAGVPALLVQDPCSVNPSQRYLVWSWFLVFMKKSRLLTTRLSLPFFATVSIGPFLI